MTTPAGGSLNTDFDLMAAIAGKTDARNEEILAMLQSFIGRMGGVPASVWGGVAASASTTSSVDGTPNRSSSTRRCSGSPKRSA